jgi:hypothetical protein
MFVAGLNPSAKFKAKNRFFRQVTLLKCRKFLSQKTQLKISFTMIPKTNMRFKIINPDFIDDLSFHYRSRFSQLPPKCCLNANGGKSSRPTPFRGKQDDVFFVTPETVGTSTVQAKFTRPLTAAGAGF